MTGARECRACFRVMDSLQFDKGRTKCNQCRGAENKARTVAGTAYGSRPADPLNAAFNQWVATK